MLAVLCERERYLRDSAPPQEIMGLSTVTAKLTWP